MCAGACARGADTSRLWELLSDLLDKGRVPDSITFKGAISALAKNGEWLQSLKVPSRFLLQHTLPQLHSPTTRRTASHITIVQVCQRESRSAICLLRTACIAHVESCTDLDRTACCV